MYISVFRALPSNLLDEIIDSVEDPDDLFALSLCSDSRFFTSKIQSSISTRLLYCEISSLIPWAALSNFPQYAHYFESLHTLHLYDPLLSPTSKSVLPVLLPSIIPHHITQTCAMKTFLNILNKFFALKSFRVTSNPFSTLPVRPLGTSTSYLEEVICALTQSSSLKTVVIWEESFIPLVNRAVRYIFYNYAMCGILTYHHVDASSKQHGGHPLLHTFHQQLQQFPLQY
ncbi:hypothetical protein M422DRAFT_56857 [Sphaerobolus stellatus SS14]|uniref:F-box domain-containing protein n=1 Tax=Sphaerobolus stellatus (strain SS14) TaxID=990650 RepID=A0A0C9UDZ8_SPHS4|nr:hypothetical protein M422DRAFT_56857 [Sphaerobolus stellatus SS14]